MTPANHRPDLDNPATYEHLDPTGMRQRLQNATAQARQGWQQGRNFVPPPSWNRIDRVVIGGMGGSAIAGDLAADLAAHQQAGPIISVRGFSLPFPLDDRTLFIPCSHSGATAETRSLYQQARDHGTPLLVIAGGGPLAQTAGRDGIPALKIAAPGEPRSAVAYMLTLLLGVLNGCGILPTNEPDVTAAVDALQVQTQRCGVDTPTPDNPAKTLAQELPGKTVVIYGGGWLTGMARRWKTQLNENAKVWAFYETLPELLHNSVEAYRQPDAGDPSAKMVLVLTPHTPDREMLTRYQAVTHLLRNNQVPHQAIEAEPGPPLSQLLTMLTLGDHLSYYLAMLNSIDPSPTPTLDLGKRLLNDATAG